MNKINTKTKTFEYACFGRGLKNEKFRDSLEVSACFILEKTHSKIAYCVALRHGWDGSPPRTFREVSECLGISSDAARKFVEKGYLMIRHPSRRRYFTKYLERKL